MESNKMSNNKRTLPASTHIKSGKNNANQNQVVTGALSLQLNRKVRLQRYPIIAKVAFLRKRQDIVSLLNAMQDSPDKMPARLKAYLKHEGLWDADTKELTDKGLQVQSSGLFEISERGLYHIWYIDNDPLLGTRPVLIQRDTAFFEPRDVKVWKKGADAAQSSFSICNKQLALVAIEEIYSGQRSQPSTSTVTLSRLEPEVVCSPQKNAEVDLSWDLQLSASLVSLKGQLDVLEFKQKTENNKPQVLELSIHDFADCMPSIMTDVAGQFEGDWDHSDQRIAASLEDIKHEINAVTQFNISKKNLQNLKTNFGQFNTVRLRNIPIKPVGQADAEQWQQEWLEGFYSRQYHSSENARLQQAQWLDHPALESFELQLKEGSSLLDRLSREQHPRAYWHAAVMEDLTPSHSKKLRLPIALVNGEPLHLEGMIDLIRPD